MYINWYKLAKIQQEAGLRETIPAALLMALLAVIGGSSLWNAAKKFDVNETQIEQALTNPNIVKALQQDMTEPNSLDLDPITPKLESLNTPLNQITPLIIEHERLLPKQTPFRITNPIMRQWNTIHGFPIDKTTPVPRNRRNFFFLQNPNDVPKAIEQQFRNYADRPSKYQLPNIPTLEDAIRKFDQENPDDKMEYIKTSLPNINFNQPLVNFFR